MLEILIGSFKVMKEFSTVQLTKQAKADGHLCFYSFIFIVESICDGLLGRSSVTPNHHRVIIIICGEKGISSSKRLARECMSKPSQPRVILFYYDQ